MIKSTRTLGLTELSGMPQYIDVCFPQAPTLLERLAQVTPTFRIWLARGVDTTAFQIQMNTRFGQYLSPEEVEYGSRWLASEWQAAGYSDDFPLTMAEIVQLTSSLLTGRILEVEVEP